MKTVALIDPHFSGHHYAFICLFAKYFLRGGNRICVFYPEKENEIREYLKAEGFDDRFVFFEKNSLQRKIMSGKRIWNLPLTTLRFWRDTSHLLKQTEKKHGLKFDFVFFAWLDDYLCNYLHHRLVDFVFNYKWSGLYFHPWYLNDANLSDRISVSSVDSVLRSQKCLTVAIHDEFNVQKLANRVKKKVVLFPEIADSTPPEDNYALAKELIEKSSGRTIVGLIGISQRKGFPTFVDAIKTLDSNKFFFFFCGPLETDQMSVMDLEKSSAFLNAVPSNCFYYPNYLVEGAKLNSIINTIDILFLIYNNFQSSSNFITKAVLFKKLVVSTDRFWMGRVTTKYQLGLTVQEGSPNASADALIKIADNRISFLEKADWHGYLAVHREENLTLSIGEIMTFDKR